MEEKNENEILEETPEDLADANDDTSAKDIYEKYKYLIDLQEKGEEGVEYTGPSLEELDNIRKQAEIQSINKEEAQEVTFIAIPPIDVSSADNTQKEREEIEVIEPDSPIETKESEEN